MTNADLLVRHNTKMCRNCFNDYDKYALKINEIKEKLVNALSKLIGSLGRIKSTSRKKFRARVPLNVMQKQRLLERDP